MKYNKSWILSLDDEKIEKFAIFENHGFGVVEAPHEEGKTIKMVECTEFDAWVISEAMNIALNGTIAKRSS